ncbi:MAG TPA: hypothetical protein VF374_03850 [Thermoplasmata archaeon]
MHVLRAHALKKEALSLERDSTRSSVLSWNGFPFASISVLVVLLTLFVMSMERGGWTWSSWTYAFAFTIMIPLVALEIKRKAIITGGALLMLFFMVVIDAGMPGMFGYSPSDVNWYDNLAHFLGTLVMTFFLWSAICWTLSPTGPPIANGRRKLWAAIATMLVVSFFFEFTEFFTDIMFGWTYFHPGIDTAGDLIFDFAGILVAGVVIARHRVSVLKRPFWHGEIPAT